ncbi:MAG: hypothetical protein Q9182_005936 [Xanthomendoza sp. 2 TL-2023]
MPRRIVPEEIAAHKTSKSCWVTLGSNVYDVTDFLDAHPGGGKLILEYGGEDVGAIMQDELSHVHPKSAYKILDEFLIGHTETVHSTDPLTNIDEHKLLDLRKPLLMQVWTGGFSKDFYLKEVHRPRRTDFSVDLFGNFLDELFTGTSWWFEVIMWLSLFTDITLRNIAKPDLPSFSQSACGWLKGLGLWSSMRIEPSLMSPPVEKVRIKLGFRLQADAITYEDQSSTFEKIRIKIGFRLQSDATTLEDQSRILMQAEDPSRAP